MNTNRVSGPTPDPGKQDTKSLGDQNRPKGLDKVKEIDPTDEDARSKGRKFQEALDQAEEDLKNAKQLRTGAPSPFETSFYTSEKSDEKKSLFGSVKQEPISTPETTPPPNVSATPPTPPPSFSSDEGAEEGDLPHSEVFWNDVDEPPDLPPQGRFMQEQGEERPVQGDSPQKKKREQEKEAAAPFGRTGKPGEKKISGKLGKESEEAEGAAAPRGKKADKESPFAEAPAAEKKKTPPGAPFPPSSKEKQETFASPPTPLSKEEKIAQMHTAARREKQQGEKEREKRPIEIQSPSFPPLPPEVAPIAQAAATQAAPYLSPQVLSLFYHIVGTIYVMASKGGVSQTEIHLNAPSFANSRFFGATILIEKYASAPDALNIRLSGSNEAVAAFNQNISSLMAAFQNGNFSFRINRIDAVYASERPLFRRKEPGRGRGGDGGLNG